MAKISVELVGDSTSLERAFARSSKSAKNFQRGMSATFTGRIFTNFTSQLAGLTGGLVGVYGVSRLVSAAFGEMADRQRAAAQTAAVIESTGKAAHVSAGFVEAYAETLMQMSGVDDEVIQGGENMLLTFRKVRNEVGLGNDIFSQATAAALDMSVALGKPMRQAALQLGKALQDPVKGLTALRRSGVTFTAAQVKQIRALAQSGRLLEAQKIILAEVTREFGGSARAAGETLPGKLNILRETLLNLAGTLAEQLAPKLTIVVDKFNEWLQDPENQQRVIDDFTTAVNNLAAAFEHLADAIGTAQNLWGKFQSIRDKLGPAFTFTGPGLVLKTREIGFAGLKAAGLWESEGKRGGEHYAQGFNEALSEHLGIVRHGQAIEARRAAELAGGAAGGKKPISTAMRNQWWDAMIGRQLNRVQDIPTLKGQVRDLERIRTLIQQRIDKTDDITRRLNLADRRLDVTRQIRQTRQTIRENRAELAQARRERAAELRENAQFAALGFGPGGADLEPGVRALGRRFRRISDAVRGTFLDTRKTRSLLATIRRLLSGQLGALSREVRAKIEQMLADIDRKLQEHRRHRQQFRAVDVDQLLAGAGLSPEQIRVLKARLSAVGPGGRRPIGGPAAFGTRLAPGAYNVNIYGDVVTPDSQKFLKDMQKRAKRSRAQTRGVRPGVNLGAA